MATVNDDLPSNVAALTVHIQCAHCNSWTEASYHLTFTPTGPLTAVPAR